MRTIDFRVDVLRGGVRFGHLRFSTPPTVYCDAAADIKLTLRGSFAQNDSVDLLNDELVPVVILDGVEYPVGVYRAGTARTVATSTGETIEVEAYDRSVILNWCKLERREFWAAGTPYETVISSYLVRAGITLAAFTPTSHTLQSDREDWDIGTSYLEIVNTLLQEINYNPIWFDLTGTAILEPYAAPSATNIKHTYGPNAVSLLSQDFSRETDLFDKPNVFIAILSNPEYPEPWTATSVNDTPSSKLSTISRGLRIPAVYAVDNIASETELQGYTDRLRDQGMQTSERVSVVTAIMPTHSVGDVVAITAPELQGIYKETSWSFALQAGSLMEHTLERTVVV